MTQRANTRRHRQRLAQRQDNTDCPESVDAKFWLLALVLALPLTALAEGQPVPLTAPLATPWSSGGQMLLGLGLTLALMAGFIWLLKRISSPVRAGNLIRVISATALGPRERAVLLEVGDKLILVGVATSVIRTLHIFGRDELALPPEPVAAENALASRFASRLKAALKRRDHA